MLSWTDDMKNLITRRAEEKAAAAAHEESVRLAELDIVSAALDAILGRHIGLGVIKVTKAEGGRFVCNLDCAVGEFNATLIFGHVADPLGIRLNMPGPHALTIASTRNEVLAAMLQVAQDNDYPGAK